MSDGNQSKSAAPLAGVPARAGVRRLAVRAVDLVDGFSGLVNTATVVVTCLLLVAIFFIVGSGVVARFVLHVSLPWTEEVASFMFIWLTFLGAAVALRERSHPTVLVLVRYFPRPLQSVVLVLSSLVVLLVALVFVYYGLGFASLLGEETATSIPVKMSSIFLAVPVCGMILIIHAVAAALRDIQSPRIEQTLEAGE